MKFYFILFGFIIGDFLVKSSKTFNNLPFNLRQAESFKILKTGLRRWILDNVPLDYG